MAAAVLCEDCKTIVWANGDWKSEMRIIAQDMWAIARYLKFPCPNCKKEGNFEGFQIIGTIEDLEKKAKEMNLNWDPSSEFGEKEDRDYIQAIGNLIKKKGG